MYIFQILQYTTTKKFDGILFLFYKKVEEMINTMFINIKGAKENNLKSVDVQIPKNKLIVFTGLSGSGKSTLALETLQRECQRQYMESMGMTMDIGSKPKVDSIEGLSPAISINQHQTNCNPRSTVGTVTEIAAYLRVLFSKLGERPCPHCRKMITQNYNETVRQEVFEIVKTSAVDDFEGAYLGTQKYLEHLKEEKAGAEEAIRITLDIIKNSNTLDENTIFKGRIETAGMLGITIDVLRDWERNGLIKVPRNSNRYRKYGLKELNRLKIIRTLRNAHYSMMSILRMLNQLDYGEINIREVIDTPSEEEDIVCAADRYITALSMAEKDVLEMLNILDAMQKATID
jgi:DNA-binding transcriptional MerR regulator/energy-coupling factor transporter ATP-binding protein EcfA2